MCTITGGSFLSGGGNMDEEESTLIWNVDEVDHFANQPEFQFTSGPILPAQIQPWFESLINTEMPYLQIWILSLPKKNCGWHSIGRTSEGGQGRSCFQKRSLIVFFGRWNWKMNLQNKYSCWKSISCSFEGGRGRSCCQDRFTRWRDMSDINRRSLFSFLSQSDLPWAKKARTLSDT